jgi:hypothetical protein
MTADQIQDAWYVLDHGKIVAGPYVYHAEAWRWIDRHHGESESMPRFQKSNASGGVQDRTTVDLIQVKLIIRTELQAAYERMVPQIEAVLRETYPNQGS